MDLVVADYQAGMSAAVVGKKYGIDGQTVLNNLRLRGITPRPAGQAVISGDKLERAMALRRQGWSCAAIGREFGVSRVAATNALKRAGQN